MRVDAAGNLYIADFGNNRVLFVSAADGTISTLAGNGIANYGGDGDNALLASLNGPSGIALDAQKNVYIADSANNRIRRVTMTPGPIVASPSSLAFDPQAVGSSGAAKTITLTNSSSNTVAFSMLSLSSPDFTLQQTSCGAALTAGASCTVSIAFAPPVGNWGSRSAALVYGDDLGNAPQSVVLTGTGLSGQLQLSATTLAFGNFALNAAAMTQALTITNSASSASRLYLNGAAISSGNSNGFLIYSTTCGTWLDPGTSCQITVQFSPTAAGVQSAALNLSTSASTAPATVALTAAVAVPQLSLDPGSLSFPSQAVNTASGLQNVTLSNTASSGTLSISSVVLNGANGGDFSFTNSCGQSLGAGTNCSVSIRFVPTAAGSRTATLTITDNAPGSPHVVNLSGTGTGAGQATVSATGLTFASTNLGTTSAAQTVTLSNTGSLAFTISGVLLGGANSGDFSLGSGCGVSLTAGASCAIAVAFAPKAVGTRTATITISNTATTRTVTLSGTGAGAAQAAVNTNALTFTYQNLGTTSTAQSVTLTNPGSAVLAIGNVAVTGANAGDFAATSNCGSSLAAGASCTITVTFTPTADGARAGTLTINNSVAAQNISLGGTGSGNYSVPGCTVLSFVAGPNPIYTNNPYGITSINANVTCPYEVRINAPNGPLFATGNGYSSTLTGNWVTSGLSFFLQQAGNTTPSGTLANLTVQVKTGQGCIATAFTASPNPIITNNTYGQTTVTAATNCSFDIHIGAPDGPIFQKGRGYRSMLTGNWVSNQMNLYLQPDGDTSSADTLSVLTLVMQPVVSSCTVTTFSAVNNPIITTTRLNTDTIQADANCPYDIRVGSPNGALLGSGQGAMTTQTGNWVVNGLSFFLQLQGNTTSAGTLSTFTVNTELPSQTIPSCAISTFSANSNPLPAAGGSAAVSVNAKCAWDLRLNDAAGSLLASGNGAGNATVTSVADGTLVYLQPQGDTNWQHNLSILTLHAGAQSSTCTALVFSSTPIVADASFGVTNITADATCPYDIRIGSPDGGLFGSGEGLTSANTGNWVLFGQVFYLQRRGDTTPAGTLATNAAIIIP